MEQHGWLNPLRRPKEKYVTKGNQKYGNSTEKKAQTPNPLILMAKNRFASCQQPFHEAFKGLGAMRVVYREVQKVCFMTTT
jgi:hypothetical protein